MRRHTLEDASTCSSFAESTETETPNSTTQDAKRMNKMLVQLLMAAFVGVICYGDSACSENVVVDVRDLGKDCIVETNDLMLFVQDWLHEGCDTDADLFVDCKIDLKDFVVFCEYWMSSMK